MGPCPLPESPAQPLTGRLEGKVKALQTAHILPPKPVNMAPGKGKLRLQTSRPWASSNFFLDADGASVITAWKMVEGEPGEPESKAPTTCQTREAWAPCQDAGRGYRKGPVTSGHWEILGQSPFELGEGMKPAHVTLVTHARSLSLGT